jgi:hypothetical protein
MFYNMLSGRFALQVENGKREERIFVWIERADR